MKCAPTTPHTLGPGAQAPPAARQTTGPDPRVHEPLFIPEFLPFRFGAIFSKMTYDSSRNPQVYEGLSQRAWRVVALLAAYPDITNAEISAIFGMDTATVTRGVAELKSRDLISTCRDPSDRRRVLNRLTDAGVALHDRIAPTRRARGRRYEACLTAEELSQLHGLLDKLSRHMDTIVSDEWPLPRQASGA